MDVQIKGYFTETKLRPKFINFRERAEKCIKHISEIADSNNMYLPYVGATLGDNPPHFVHHELDWIEVLPYAVYGMTAAREITGTEYGKDVQVEQRRLLLKAFDNLDGLAYSSHSPWNRRYPMALWDQARAMMALLAWYLDTHEEMVLGYLYRLVDGIWNIAIQDGRKIYFKHEHAKKNGLGPYATGNLIENMMKFYEITGYEKAFLLARGLFYLYSDINSGYFGPNGEFYHYFRAAVTSMGGMARYAVFSGEQKNIDRVKIIYDHAVGLCTRFGATPDKEPVCSGMDLITCALELTKDGYYECWDQIDRFFRNQIVESQFLDAGEWVAEKAAKSRQKRPDFSWITGMYPDDMEILPHDDYNDVVNRCIGGFMYTSHNEHQFTPGALMLCCSGHAMWVFHKILGKMILSRDRELQINLPYNHESKLAEVISHEPYTGRLEVIPKDDFDNLKIRVPLNSNRNDIECIKNGQRIDSKIAGGYAHFGEVKTYEMCCIKYPLEKKETDETLYDFSFTPPCFTPSHVKCKARWRGNTVIELIPESDNEKRIYKDRKGMDTDTVVYDEIKYFIPKDGFYW